MKALEIALFWILTLAAGGFFVWTIRQRIGTMKAGLPDNRTDRPMERLKGVFVLAWASSAWSGTSTRASTTS